jgi:signal transduction histidine kinase
MPAKQRPPGVGPCTEIDDARLRTLASRVRRKLADAGGYDFNIDELRMLGIFFELAQEFDSRRDLLSLSVLLPEICFGQQVRLYLRTGRGTWTLERSLHPPDELPSGEPPPWSTTRGAQFFTPIKARPDTEELVGFPLANGVLGWIEVLGGAALPVARQLFYEIYAGRVGQQMHNQLTRAKNREHLAFIQTLVADIGHNVIVPNMSFKLFFNHLRGSINSLRELLAQAPEGAPPEFTAELRLLAERMGRQHEEISHHYEQTSLFLETLMRRRHFEEGRYVLERRPVDLNAQVIAPQVDRYRPRLEDKGIEIAADPADDDPLLLMADLGLMAQVYANLFSNAVKYTREVHGPDGCAFRRMTYGWRRVPDAFGPRSPGVRLFVRTTGPVIAPEERPSLFRPGFRASGAQCEHGTGHGLAFIKQVVDLHGGRVEYEPTQEGNAFTLLLPLDVEDIPPG